MNAPFISFILPSFHKAALFEKAFFAMNNRVFLDPDTEVIIVLEDHSDERWYVNFARCNKVRFRVIVTDNIHAWRQPACAINAGVRHALGTHIAIMSPETCLSVPPNFLSAVANHRQMHGGLLWNVSGVEHWMMPYDLYGRIQHMEVTAPPGQPGYGFLMCPKEAYTAINGMDEGREGYGNDDDSIRIRLIRFGLQFNIDSRIRAFHIWHDNGVRNTPAERQCVGRNVMLDHQPDWGRAEPWRLAFDWRNE